MRIGPIANGDCLPFYIDIDDKYIAEMIEKHGESWCEVIANEWAEAVDNSITAFYEAQVKAISADKEPGSLE